MTKLKLVAIVLGGLLTWFGYKEWKLGSAASETPQTLSCAELEAAGPGGNAHVVVSDFLLLEQAFVYQGKEGSARWDKVWIPAVPLGGEYHQELLARVDSEGKLAPEDIPLPRTIRVIVKSSEVHNKQDLARVADAATIQGLVINEIESLGKKERELLAQSYPGIDFNRVWILEHERKPSNRVKSIGFLGGGALLALAGIGAFFVGRD